MFEKLLKVCCCSSAEEEEDHHRQPQIDESTRLIPDTLSPSLSTYSSNPALLNQHRIRERLGTIVRAKERKMVNVVSQIPFNLHKPPPNRLPHPHHSRSRSLSASVSSEYLPNHHDPFSSSSRHRSYTYYTSAPPPTSRFYSDPNPYTLSTIHSSPLGYPSEDIDYADADTGGPKYVFGAHIVHDRDRPPNPRPRGNSKAPRRGRSTNSRYLHLPDMPSSSSNSLGTGTPPEYRSDEEDDDGGEGFQEEEEGDEGDDTPQPRSRRARQHKDILNLKDSGAITFSWGDSPVRG